MYITKTKYGYRLSECINDNTIIFSKHSCDRCIERFKSLGIKFNTDDEYYDAMVYSLKESITNKFMSKYINNLMHINTRNRDVLVYDERSNMVFALYVEPYKINVKTIAYNAKKDWLYKNDTQRICWIYADTFKFSTSNGNVTWY